MRYRFNITAFYSDILPAIIFIFSIPIDAINGYFQYFKGVHLPIGFIFRGFILLLVIKFILKDIHETIHRLFFLCVSILILIYPIYILLEKSTSSMTEIEYLFKFIYFFSILFYFYHFRYLFNIVKLIKMLIYAIFILACINIYSLITGFGIPSYAYGFGYSGFYFGGNELGIYMIISLLICIWFSFYTKSLFYYLLTIVASCGILVIGTRVAVLGTFLDWILCSLYFLINKDYFIKIKRFYRIFFLLAIILFMVVSISYIYETVIMYSSFMSEKFSSDALLSSRSILIDSAKQVIKDFDVFEFLFGKSVSGGRSAMALIYHTKSDLKNVESDFYDIILSFGFFLGGLIMLLYFKIIGKFILSFFKKDTRNSLSFIICISACLLLGSAYTAGHTFMSVDLAPVLGLYWIVYLNINARNKFISL